MASRAGFILCIALVCALGAGASRAHADTPPPATTIADGVQIGSVAVGGMTADEATAAVRGAYLAPLVLHVGHRGVSVLPRHFHAAVPVGPAVQTALTAEAGTVVPLAPSFDLQLVKKWVATLAQETYRAPIASRLILRHSKPFATHARPGRSLVKLATRVRIVAALRSGARATIFAPLEKLQAQALKPEPVIVIRRGSNRLSLFQGTRLVQTFPVATGMPQYPTPLGRFEIVVKWVNPWWYPPTQDAWAAGPQAGAARAGKPARDALDGPERAGCRHPRHGRAVVDRPLGVARLHPDAGAVRGMAVRARQRRDAGLHRRRIVMWCGAG